MKQKTEIRVISLPDQKKRRERMRKILYELNDWQFVDAISGNDISYEIGFYDREKRMKVFGYDMRINELACFLSHRKVWQQCVHMGCTFLILEDDVSINPNLTSLDVMNFLNVLNCREDLFLRLGNSDIRSEKKMIKKINSKYGIYRYKKDPLGAFAYIISPQTAEKLLERSQSIFTPVDDFMWRGWEHGCMLFDVSDYIFFTTEEGNPSTIGSRKKPELPLYKKIRREWYRFLDNKNKKRYEYACYKNTESNE